MRKHKKLLLIILSILIFLVIFLLALKPVVLKNKSKDEDKNKTQTIDILENKENEGSITLGINVTYTGKGITFDDYTNTLTIKKGGSFDISGVLLNGQIVIDAPDVVTLNMQGVNITNNVDAAIKVKNVKSLKLNLTPNTTNELTNNSINSTISSNYPLTISGSGDLTLTNQVGNGINCASLELLQTNLTINAFNKTIETEKNIIVKQSWLILMGNAPINNFDSKMEQNALVFKLPRDYTSADNLTLATLEGNSLNTINPKVTINSLIISNPSLTLNNTYQLINSNDTGSEKIVIAGADSFTITNLITTFSPNF